MNMHSTNLQLQIGTLKDKKKPYEKVRLETQQMKTKKI